MQRLTSHPKCPASQAWIPMSGSWIWWYDPYLLVLCEDSSSSLFADARPRFQHVAEVDSCKVLKEDQAWWLKDWLESRFPEAYSYAGIYKFQGYQVIGMGGTVEHRMRAACVGLGMLMCKDRSSLPRQWQPVWDEVHDVTGPPKDSKHRRRRSKLLPGSALTASTDLQTRAARPWC